MSVSLSIKWSCVPSDPAYLSGKPEGQKGKIGTGMILPGHGQLWVGVGPRVWVRLSFVTLGEVSKFRGPQFPLL